MTFERAQRKIGKLIKRCYRDDCAGPHFPCDACGRLADWIVKVAAPAAQQAPAPSSAPGSGAIEELYCLAQTLNEESRADLRRRVLAAFGAAPAAPPEAPAVGPGLTEEERRTIRQQAGDWGAVAAEARGGGDGAKANVAEQNRAVLLRIIDRIAPKEQP